LRSRSGDVLGQIVTDVVVRVLQVVIILRIAS
jgi:hypothetical protein